jgi:hypothetical protein
MQYLNIHSGIMAPRLDDAADPQCTETLIGKNTRCTNDATCVVWADGPLPSTRQRMCAQCARVFKLMYDRHFHGHTLHNEPL